MGITREHETETRNAELRLMMILKLIDIAIGLLKVVKQRSQLLKLKIGSINFSMDI